MEFETPSLGSRKKIATTNHKKPPPRVAFKRESEKKFTANYRKAAEQCAQGILLLLLLRLLVFSSYKLVSEIIESFVSHRPVFNLESMAISMIFLQQKSEPKAWISTLKSTMRLQLIQVYPLKGGLELRWAYYGTAVAGFIL
ncbi:hypothetical protein NC651_001667 [Populus alba x Populus x berolinensis]|nr:hypothetical protein NC651_001667 [Populus alba x Populus x berolinensis]